MLLIDILNEIHFGGDQYSVAMIAAGQRTRSLSPIFGKLLNYAAQFPEAYSSRFSDGLLTSAAFLLAEANDRQFIDLVRPLIDSEAERSLLEDFPVDAARLVSIYLEKHLDEIPSILNAEPGSYEFRSAVLEACVLISHWNPSLRPEIVSIFRQLIRSGFFGQYESGLAHTLLDCCSRLGASEFVLDLQISVDRDEIDQKWVSQVLNGANFSKEEPVKVEDWERIVPLTAADPLFRKYSCAFSAEEIASVLPTWRPDEKSLADFNRVSVPSRLLKRRFAKLQSDPRIIEVCTGVIALAVSDPEEFRARHNAMAVTTAICLAAPMGDSLFTEQFLRLLSLEAEYLDSLLSDDLTQFCDAALALSARNFTTGIQELIANSDVTEVTKWVALDALALQVHCGFLPTSKLSDYIQSFIDRREELGKSWTLWPNLVQVAAKVGLRQFEPFFVSMLEDGYLVEDDGTVYYDREDIIKQFDDPYDGDVPRYKTTAVELLESSPYLKSYLCTEDFMGRLQPPAPTRL